AAVAASRLGSRVVLIERTSHIGGLPANGLGVTDIATRATIGGLFKEFVTAVKQHYVKTYGADSQQVKDCSDGYHFEPRVAEQVFERLLSNAANVRVLTQHQFDGQTEVENQKLESIMVTNRGSGEKIQIKAKAFVDATYEGDLADAAGVPYRIGREGRDETLEPYAGVFYSYFGTLSPEQPGFKAMQYFGARGFFPLWEAEPQRPVLRGEAIAWFEKLGTKIWDRSRPLETLDWDIQERWLDTKLRRGEHLCAAS
ncbi:MAG: FAD-dependent oxidoreductase, partial [Terriglobia bacterium]